VRIRDRQIVSYSTFVTGELYGLLTTYSVVAKTEKKPVRMDKEAFRSGLRLGLSRNAEAAGGLLSTIFSARSKRVLGELSEEQQPDYLSGLLIGEELAGVERVLAREQRKLGEFSRILLAGERDLCARYEEACEYLAWPMPGVMQGATEKGLWSVAREAGLVK
jgi:2-dehydro-3-deoxygalactonokinase